MGRMSLQSRGGVARVSGATLSAQHLHCASPVPATPVSIVQRKYCCYPHFTEKRRKPRVGVRLAPSHTAK